MTFTIQEALSSAKNQLFKVADNPLLEAEILLANVLNKSRSYLHTWSDELLSQKELNIFSFFLSRRLNDEPIAYITGKREFWSLELLVDHETLIPRHETEWLVETTLDFFRDDLTSIKVAELGTGCGAIALALAHERPHWSIYATDISEKALQLAKKNAQRLSLTNVNFYQGHWCMALPENDFDIMMSNPPYLSETDWHCYAQGLSFEPRAALVSGVDGLDAIRTILYSAKNYIKPAAYVVIEHGYLQGAQVRRLFAAARYGEIRSVRDFLGHERVTLGRSL